MKNILYVVLGLSIVLNALFLYWIFNSNNTTNISADKIIVIDREIAKSDITQFISKNEYPHKGYYIPKELINRLINPLSGKSTGICVYFGLSSGYVEKVSNSYDYSLEIGKASDCYKLASYCPLSCGSLGQ